MTDFNYLTSMTELIAQAEGANWIQKKVIKRLLEKKVTSYLTAKRHYQGEIKQFEHKLKTIIGNDVQYEFAIVDREQKIKDIDSAIELYVDFKGSI